VLGQFGMAMIKGDRQRILDLGHEAITAALARNETSVAMLFEIFLGGNMLQVNNLAEAATFLDDLTERFREQSAPPTYMTWALYLAGATAAMRGDDQRAETLYLAAASVDVPPRTNTPNETLAARQAFNDGHPDQAFSILRSLVDELLDAGNHSGVVLVGLEFVTMTNSLDRLESAAIVVGHLRSAGFLRDPNTGLAALIADVAVRVDNNPRTRAIAEQAQSRDLDQRDTLRVIRDTLDVLIAELRRS
ncbi:MAG: hypothetical protein WBB15_08590, partial [Ornithinimicrobium sp.]